MLYKMIGYYFITDSHLSRAGSLHDVKCAVDEGVEIVQYRQKDASTRDLLSEARDLQRICQGTSTRFIINDRVDIALAINADGVHIGQDDMPYDITRKLLGPGKIIGVTVHNVREAAEAECMGADYLGVSPIFATGTKLDAGKPSGITLIEEIKRKAKIPLVAIGGITISNAPDVISAGADAICAISAVVTKDNVVGEIRRFQSLFSTKGDNR
mgnify:CR=1 FL=1